MNGDRHASAGVRAEKTVLPPALQIVVLPDWTLGSVASAVRSASSWLLLLTWGPDRDDLDQFGVLELGALQVMTLAPWLTAAALASPRAEGRSDLFTRLAPSEVAQIHAPDALLLRVDRVRFALGALTGGQGDPGAEVIARLSDAGVVIDWRWAPVRLRPMAHPVLPAWASSRPWIYGLGEPSNHAPVRMLAAPGMGPWSRVGRLGYDGQLVAMDGDSRDDLSISPVALLSTRPGPRSVPVWPRGEDTNDAFPLGFAWEQGLPGDIPLMRFHDPARALDFVGIAGQSFPGCHPSRMLGWAREDAVALAPAAEATPLGRRVLVQDGEGGWATQTPDDVGTTCQPRGMLIADARPGTRPVFVGSQDGRPVLDTAISTTTTDVALVGHVWIEDGSDRTPLTGSDGLTLGYMERLSPGARSSVRDHSAPSPRRSKWQHSLEALSSPTFHPGDSIVRRRVRALAATKTGRATRESIGRIRASSRRVLLVLPWLTPGGADTFLRALINDLSGKGFECDIVLTHSRDESPPDGSDAFRGLVNSITCPADDCPGTPLPVLVRDLVHTRRTGHIAICGGWHLYEALPGLRRALPGVGVLDILFNDVGHIARNRQYAAFIDTTTCAYRGLQDALIDRYGASPDDVPLVYIGVDVDRFRPLNPVDRAAQRRRLGFDPSRPLWAFLGRLSEEKRVLDFLEAVSRLPASVDAQILIQGEGPAADEVHAAAALVPRDVIVRPFADDPLATMQVIDSYVLTSRVEGIPLAVMEAAACGAVLVATAVGGVPEVVQSGRTGYLAQALNVGTIASALVALSETPSWMRADMGRAARDLVVSRMRWSQTVDAYEALFSR